MPAFNPFGKKTEELDIDDLQTLARDGVADGWFVQCEAEMPDATALAHAVAGFANSDGGWLIIGVETDNESRVVALPGCAPDDAHTAAALRDVVETRVEPSPAFVVRVLPLDEGQRVVVIFAIEPGARPPYLGPDGRIYRRAATSPHPVVETDRYAIRRLFDRAADDDARVEGFCRDPFATFEQNPGARQPFLELYFCLQPRHAFEMAGFSTEPFMERIVEHFSGAATLVKGSGDNASVPSGATASIPFNAIAASTSSYVLRSYAEDDSLTDPVLTIELFDNGDAKMFLPVPTLSRDRLALPSFYQHSPYLARLERALGGDKHSVRITDGFELLLSLAVLTSRYVELLSDEGCQQAIDFRLRLNNAARSVVFVDDPRYSEFVERHGPPVCFKPLIEHPRFGAGDSTLLEIDVQAWIRASTCLFESLGVPMPVFADSVGGFFRYIEDLAKLRRAASSAF